MNINKTLCKYFDVDGKGYVTVGNITEYILKFSAIVIITLGFLYCIYRGTLDIIAMVYGTHDPNILSGLNYVAGGMGVLFILLISLAVLLVLIVSISEMKIAKCELKKDDNGK